MADRRSNRSEEVIERDTPATGSHSVGEYSHEATQTPVNVHVPGPRADQVRWGPVWAGVLTALALFLIVELLFFWLGWLTLAQDEPGSTAGWISGLIALGAFFVGGLIAGASAVWKGLATGLLQGTLVWALGVTGILFLTLFGGGALLGSFGSIVGDVANLSQLTSQLSGAQAAEAVDAARTNAGWAVLSLALALAAAAVGGIMGAKIWPRNEDTEASTTG